MNNSGNCNSGDYNTGDYNTGDSNSGNCNTGNRNSGYWNSGDSNSGNCNTGNRNSGYWNSGDYNTGDYNTGDSNSGNCNTGDCNSGYWNSGDYNTGFFNTTRTPVFIFNKKTDLKEIDFPDFLYFKLTEWITTEKMSEKEKQENEGYEILGGYLRKYEYKEAFGKAYENATKTDIEKLKNLPNFDAEIFKEISGIDINKEPEKTIEIEGKEFSETTIKKALKEYINKLSE